ncbi:MAG: epoxyqueuosine reductase [Methanomicrobiaceae archaeon]|nr:epoxyqueuosine reductase [Methanomicrobiaceae archaeon]
MKDSAAVITDELSGYIRETEAAISGYGDLSAVSSLPFPDLKTGISLGINLNPRIVLSLRNGPDDNYVREYESINERLYSLSKEVSGFLTDKGYNAAFITPTRSINDPKRLFAEFPHKTAATAAGLGWIGKSALLITREFGPAVRFTTVFTNAPLITAKPVAKSYCGFCDACKQACPAGAVSGREWSPELFRDEFWDAGLCFEYSRNRGSLAGSKHPVCGICIAACPWTEKYLKREGLL